MAARDSCTIRISKAGLGLVDQIAQETSSTRSEALRAILSEAFAADAVMAAARRRLARSTL